MSSFPGVSNDFQAQIDRVRAGLPVRDALALIEHWGIPVKELGRLLGVSERTLSRLRSGDPDHLLSSVETDRLMRVETLLEKAGFVLEDAARHWLQAPVKALGDQTPLSLMDTDVGCAQVDLVLGRIQHGIFS